MGDDCDWRKVAYVCSIIHLVLTSIRCPLWFLLILVSARIIGGGITTDVLLMTLCIFGWLFSIGQIVVNVYMKNASHSERVMQNRQQCYTRALAFLIYSVIFIVYQFGIGGYSISAGGDAGFLASGGVDLILTGLCVPFLFVLKQPPQPQQTPSQMGDPNMMYNPNDPNNPNMGGYPQLQQGQGFQYPPQQQQGEWQQQGGYPPQQQGGWQQQGGYPQQGAYGYSQFQQPNQGGYPQMGGYPQLQQPQQGGFPQPQQPNQGQGQALQNPWASPSQTAQK